MSNVNGLVVDRGALPRLARDMEALADRLRERAAQIADDIGDAETAAEVRGRNDQPAQDGGRLDPYTKKRAMEVAEEVRRRNLPYKKRSSLAHGAVVAASAIRQAIHDLQPDQPADAGEPSCCTRTREGCARVCDERAQAEQALADACDRAVETEDWSTHNDRARQLRECAAAIRRTGDTGGGDE
jgi:hypothetical protein